MSFGRQQRDVPAGLLFVVVIAMAGCGGDDAPPQAPSPRPAATASAAPADPAETPAAEVEASPVAGPRRAEIVRRLDGRTIRVQGAEVGIDPQTLACGRAGTTRPGGRRARIRLRCVQPTFPAGSLVGPDATFFVHVSRAGRLVITNARFTSY